MAKAKVSVIVPVYNAGQYLEPCLSSIANQTLREIEILCVDDGSTDDSLEILKRYEAQDSRFRVLQQKNQYAGVARNNGISVATGEYYIFLDSDDFFEPELLESLYEKGKAQQSDLVLCGADQYNVASGAFEDMSWLLSEQLIRQQPVNRHTLPDKIFQLSSLAPWNKLVSAALVAKHTLRFQALPRANDAFFSMMALALAERITAVDKVLVHYRVGMSSNLQAKNHLSPLAFCEALEAVKQRLEKEGIFESVERSFAENALSQMVYNLKKLRERPVAYRILAGNIRETYMERFGVLKAMDAKELDPHLAKELLELLEHIPAPSLQLQGLSLPEAADTPFVSLIIPVYNVERYLPECLDSALKQTLQNIEILCVNDGSPDGSAAILEEYRQRDPRIRVITQNNGGLSVARNSALRVARGEYVFFLDSDDLIEPDALETLYRVSRANALDLLYFDFVQFFESGNPDKRVERKVPALIYDGVSFGKLLKDQRDYLGAACMQLFRREFLTENHLTFYPGIIHEDELFMFRALMAAERVAHIPLCFYRYRIRDNSIMTTIKSAKHVSGYFTCAREMLAYGLGETHDPVKNAEIFRAVMAMQEKAKQYYGWISTEEKLTLHFDDPLSMLLFEKLILEMNEGGFAGATGSQNQQVLAMVNRTLTQELEETRASASYRIGRLITWVPRKIRGLIRCFQMHGPGYTLERIKAHFRREE